MKRILLLVILINVSIFAQTRMKRITMLTSGLFAVIDGRIVCGDFNHNGNNDMLFRTRFTPAYVQGWQIWEYRPLNSYELVYADTGSVIYPPPTIDPGWLNPFAADYMDQDSVIDLVGQNIDSTTAVSTVMEGPNSSSYPINLVWFSSLGVWYTAASHYITDLDQDGRKEILLAWDGTRIYENTGDNQYQLVFNQPPSSWRPYAFGDFDQDGRMDFAFPGSSPDNVRVRECAGDNQYPIVWSSPFPSGLTNPYDCWSGQDVDNDGKPEFFIAYQNAMQNIYYLYMGEAISNNNYELTYIDQIRTYQDAGRVSECGDIDGDNIEEIIWSVGCKILIYKATGNNQFQRVLTIDNYHGGEIPTAIISIYDMNKNGYNEIIYGGTGYTSIYEIEAIQIIRPNGGEVLQDSTQELIRWQKFSPPRCDSISLFYSTNNGNNYTMITHGLSGNDTSYLWTVPNINSDSCKIKIIAYGPGWQYDESDGIFRISSVGIEERLTPNALRLTLQVSPNPAKSLTEIRYSLPAETKVSLSLFDISGRLVKVLVDENKKPGNYSFALSSKTLCSGVYFLSLQTENKRIIERLVVVK